MYVHYTNLEHYIKEQFASNILPVGNPIDLSVSNS